MTRAAVIFDLDGTLVDTAGDLCAALQHTLRSTGVPLCDLQTMRQWVGYGALALLRQGFAAQKRSVTEDELEQHRQFFLAFYREHLSVHSRPFPHAVSMLETLQAQGYELGVCTNKPHDLAVCLLDDLGLRAYFTGVCGYADDGVRKPDKKLLLRTLQRMNIEPSRDSVMVGDSLADAQAAQGCNLRFVGVSFGYGTLSAENTKDAPVDVIIDDLAELPNVLQKSF